MEFINGFSKFSKKEKILWLEKNVENYSELKEFLSEFNIGNSEVQNQFDNFSENTVSNYHLPFGVAPNMVINNRTYTIPMVTEESSVVAAVATSNKFWAKRGGFKSNVISTTKIGHVHFLWQGDADRLKIFFKDVKEFIRQKLKSITSSMESRGGGILDIKLIDKTNKEKDYFQLEFSFETCDAMGANFINTVLEESSHLFKAEAQKSTVLIGKEKEIEIIMCILSNYTPDCLVESYVECPIEDLGQNDNLGFAKRFVQAVRIAEIEPYRATTHNKGIMNGIDAVVMATGNDFRAVESCAHAYAAKNGHYSSLTKAEITEEGFFRFSIKIPLALGTIGGLTKAHPLAKFSLELLGKPSSEELMKIVASTGVSQNFGAIKALTTHGIQKGHMKMHLGNILNQLEVTAEEKKATTKHFANKTVSVSAVKQFLNHLRKSFSSSLYS